ncbi:GyrI-like domain-containing protein [Colwellia sp. KU-HH00111]|uniref:GyrI-like domain-containing protein n=1 Tax=Colwellia sp. KU-HH00111 TaxID=3127652 RepID=UPI00310217A9
MEVRFISKTITISGFSIRTDNATEMDPQTGQIAKLWQTFDKTVPVDYKNGERIYGVYSDYESDHTGKFTVLAGFDGNDSSSQSQLESITIPEGKYLVFSHKGDMPQIAIDAWTEVWHYFSQTNTEYKRRFSIDFEFYPNGNEIEVHIAIL